MSVSPLTIQTAIAFYALADPLSSFTEAERNSPAMAEVIRWLDANGLIHLPDPEGCYQRTDRLDAWIRFICATPLPVQQWTLP